MILLLDTQAFIWFVENDKQLSEGIKLELEDLNNQIVISIASLWEMTIKMSLGKLQLTCDMINMIDKIHNNGFEILPILTEHLIKLGTLEYLHRDPFDRIIIAQGLCENIPIVSSDKVFDQYGINRRWHK